MHVERPLVDFLAGEGSRTRRNTSWNPNGLHAFSEIRYEHTRDAIHLEIQQYQWKFNIELQEFSEACACASVFVCAVCGRVWASSCALVEVSKSVESVPFRELFLFAHPIARWVGSPEKKKKPREDVFSPIQKNIFFWEGP